MNRFIRHLNMQRVPIGIGIDGHGLDAHPAGGLDDPAGDFAAIGDQDSLEHAAATPTHDPEDRGKFGTIEAGISHFC